MCRGEKELNSSNGLLSEKEKRKTGFQRSIAINQIGSLARANDNTLVASATCKR